jgi:hypothetical protein
MGLEQMVNEITRNMVICDVHVPYQDDNALAVVEAYAAEYKPDVFVINGDLVDFYNLSVFDKNPERKVDVQGELDGAQQVLHSLRSVLPKGCKMYFLEGNHENRLQRYLWRNPELEGLRALELPTLLGLEDLNIEFIGVSADYWKKDSGHLNLGDALVMHGDNRLNGASTSKYSGYSAKNTMMGLQKSTISGHVHRLAQVYHTTPYGTLTGIEGGCLCQPTGTANWQQGFVTFETVNGKNINYRLHRIDKGEMFDGKYFYTTRT